MTTTVLLVNYNGCDDTLFCLNSIFNNLNDINVIIVDNNSKLISKKKLKIGLSSTYLVQRNFLFHDYTGTIFKYKSSEIVLIESSVNLGFGGGNNIGLEYVLQNNLSDYVWILNNDTYLKNDSLTPLIKKAKNDIAFVGSTLIYSFDEETVQCTGGAKYYSLIGKPKLINKHKKVKEIREYGGRISYINGASMLMPISVLKNVGLFDESYFMYSEEHDWQIRAKKMGKKITYAHESIVYHKESASIRKNSNLYLFYTNRSLMLFSLRYYPWHSFTTFLFLALQAFVKAKRFQDIIYSYMGLFSGIRYFLKSKGIHKPPAGKKGEI